LLWLAEWLGVDRCSVNSVLLHVVVVMENGWLISGIMVG
jgi:hypothetical protein